VPLAVGKVIESEACFDVGLAIAPRRFGLWKGKALANDRNGNARVALDLCNTALELQPGDLDLLRCKLRILVSFGHWEAAAKAVGDALALDSGDQELNILAQKIAAASVSVQSGPASEPAHWVGREEA
jgi:predicted Zn-dependent protease